MEEVGRRWRSRAPVAASTTIWRASRWLYLLFPLLIILLAAVYIGLNRRCATLSKVRSAQTNDTVEALNLLMQHNEQQAQVLQQAADVLQSGKPLSSLLQSSALLASHLTASAVHRTCPSCPPCPSPSSAPSCPSSVEARADCSCPSSSRIPMLLDDYAFTEEKLQKRPLCTEGDSLGTWVNYTTWQSYTCTYRDWEQQELLACLAGKWVHFYGDHNSLTLATAFASAIGVSKEVLTKEGMERERTAPGGGAKRQLLQAEKEEEGKETKKLEVKGNSSSEKQSRAAPSDGAPPPLVRVSFVSRLKMAHQRAPKEGTTEEEDLNSWFLGELRLRSDALAKFKNEKKKGPVPPPVPDILVFSVGSHEVIGWSGRPRVRLDLNAFRQDTEEALSLFKGSYPRGRLIWWKAHYVHTGKVKGWSLFDARQQHEQYQDYATRRFKESGYAIADFFQTTRLRPELVSGSGVHYNLLATTQHVKILANMMCNKGSQD